MDKACGGSSPVTGEILTVGGGNIPEVLRQALIRLWTSAFTDDTPSDAGDFLRLVPGEGDGFVRMEQGVPVSAVFSLPARLISDTGACAPIRYIYAAATAPEFRGRGLFPALLRRAHADAQAEGADAMFLRPAKPWLCGYYEKFGYRPFFYVRHVTLTGRELLSAPANPAGTRVEWPAKLRGYERLTAERENGALVTAGGGTALCLPAADCPDTVEIRHWDCPPGCAELGQAVLERFGGVRYSLRLPAFSTGGGEGEPFGWLCPLEGFRPEQWISGEAMPYMGMALD